MQGIGHRLNKGLLAKLHDEVVKAFNANKLNLQVAKELTNVKPERQLEILKLMESCKTSARRSPAGWYLRRRFLSAPKRMERSHRGHRPTNARANC